MRRTWFFGLDKRRIERAASTATHCSTRDKLRFRITAEFTMTPTRHNTISGQIVIGYTWSRREIKGGGASTKAGLRTHHTWRNYEPVF